MFLNGLFWFGIKMLFIASRVKSQQWRFSSFGVHFSSDLIKTKTNSPLELFYTAHIGWVLKYGNKVYSTTITTNLSIRLATIENVMSVVFRQSIITIHSTKNKQNISTIIAWSIATYSTKIAIKWSVYFRHVPKAISSFYGNMWATIGIKNTTMSQTITDGERYIMPLLVVHTNVFVCFYQRAT